MTLQELGTNARAAARVLATAGTKEKNAALHAMADALLAHTADILAANAADIAAARENGMRESLIDRLALSEERIRGMADGMREVAALTDPVGEVMEGYRRPNGLAIRKVRVPMGVIGIIYEARPNLTADAAAL